MSWTLGSWKRQADVFHLTLGYGDRPSAGGDGEVAAAPADIAIPIKVGEQQQQEGHGTDIRSPLGGPADLMSSCKYQIPVDWIAGEDEDQVALKLQSQLMVTLPAPSDEIVVVLEPNPRNGGIAEDGFRDPAVANCDGVGDGEDKVRVTFGVRKTGELLRMVSLSRTVGSGPSLDGLGLLDRLLDRFENSNLMMEQPLGPTDYWRVLSMLNLSNCSITTLPVALSKLPMLERLYLDNNKITTLPPELGQLQRLKVLRADHNLIVTVPTELRQCLGLVELSLEHNKLVRPLLDFRAMSELLVLRLFGNPLEFLPEILPCKKLRHLSLANVRIEADQNLSHISVEVEAVDNTSYFAASKHRLSAFFGLIFRFSSCQHPLLASALAKLTDDNSNRAALGKDESAVRQLLSMVLSDDTHVVEQACIALSALAVDTTLVLRLMRADVVQAVEVVLRSTHPDLLISVLKVVVNIAFTSDDVASKVFTREIFRRLKGLCLHENPGVQRQALLAIGNLAFSSENRRTLVASESLRDMLLRLSYGPNVLVCKAAARALGILGENDYLRRAVKGKPVSKRGIRILSMDGGGMRGLATSQMLRRLEKGTGKHIHELFDLICGTSTGGMLAVGLGIKQLSLDECEEIYKSLGKVVFADPPPKKEENEAATWREKLDQLYKSSSQNFRVVVHGSKHNAEEFEKLLKKMCADDDGDLLIDTVVKPIPKVFAVSTLVSVAPAQPFVFRNYQYPPGTPETSPWTADGPAASVAGTAATAVPLMTPVGPRRTTFMGSCKHQVWEAIRASSAAPYYLDDYSSELNRWQDGAIVANNPTVIALREAQLLWPDTPIHCLVSMGCGNVPTKVRGKGGWRYVDTGQVLIESACSVERVEEALDTLIPLVDGIRYFRFNPVDERCNMELDETDPAVWARLDAATQDYIQSNDSAFHETCDCLEPSGQGEDTWYERNKSNTRSSALGRPSIRGVKESDSALGWRRGVLLAEVRRSPEFPKPYRHTRSLEAFCNRHSIKLEHLNSPLPYTLPVKVSAGTPFASPSVKGSFPTSPLLYNSPEIGHHTRFDVPDLSLDGVHGASSIKTQNSPPFSPPTGPRQFVGTVQALHEKIQCAHHVGIVHLALHSDITGLVTSWRSDIISVAEPGEMAEEFLRRVRGSMLRCRSEKSVKRRNVQLPKIATLSDLVGSFPRFMLGGAMHRFMGRHTQVLPDGQEVGSYLFRRTLPAEHLRQEDVRWMVGAWRERIVICTGRHGPHAGLVRAFLEAGAKAVIAPASEPPETHRSVGEGLDADGDGVDSDDGRFVIEDEEEEADAEPTSPDGSDWEDNELDRLDVGCEDQERDEKEVASMVGVLYDALYREGWGANASLKHALEAYPRQHYRCHLSCS